MWGPLSSKPSVSDSDRLSTPSLSVKLSVSVLVELAVLSSSGGGRSGFCSGTAAWLAAVLWLKLVLRCILFLLLYGLPCFFGMAAAVLPLGPAAAALDLFLLPLVATVLTLTLECWI